MIRKHNRESIRAPGTRFQGLVKVASPIHTRTDRPGVLALGKLDPMGDQSPSMDSENFGL
jgi:hypothetical protein